MVNKFVLGTAVIGVALSGCNYAVASDCDYTKKVNTQWTQEIQKTENINREVFPYVEDTRKCVMTMDVTVDGSIYPAEGSYVFGPDMTENAACENAAVNAKKSIISQVSPEVLSANTDMVCKSEDTVVVAEAPVVNSVPTETVVVQNSQPIVTERIISGKVIDTYPSDVVYSNNNSNWGGSIVSGTSNVIRGIFGSVGIGGVHTEVLESGNIHVQLRKKGACYATFDGNAGKVCY